jgi:hypothetical protein
VTRYVGDDNVDHLLHTGPVSDRDHAEERHSATLTVAAHARDAEDCRLLLLVLGLLGEE